MGAVLIIASLALFGFGLYFCCRGKPEIKAIFAAGALCLVFAFLREFKYFEVYGVKAELLDKKIETADKTIARLEGLSRPMAELLFTLSARAGRWVSGIPRRDRYRMMEELESELRKIGLSDAEIEGAKQDWHRFNLYDLAEPVFDPVLARIETKRTEQNQRTDRLSYPKVVDTEAYNREVEHLWHISAEGKRLEMTRSLDNVDSVYRGLMSFLDTTDVFTDDEKRQVLVDIKEELEDLKYYSENKKFRRLEHWMQSEKTE